MDFRQLIQLPESKRDEAWEKRFLQTFAQEKVGIVDDGRPVNGPDGLPYLRVKTEGEEPVEKVARWLAGRGIGMVVNAHKMIPDYVFTYGMLWNFAETGSFLHPQPTPARADEELIVPEGAMIGAPSDSYLPPYVRSVLREFLAAQGIHDPQVVVITDKTYTQTDLVFNQQALGDLTPQDQGSLAQILSWFVPMHYNLAFAPEGSLRGWVNL